MYFKVIEPLATIVKPDGHERISTQGASPVRLERFPYLHENMSGQSCATYPEIKVLKKLKTDE